MPVNTIASVLESNTELDIDPHTGGVPLAEGMDIIIAGGPLGGRSGLITAIEPTDHGNMLSLLVRSCGGTYTDAFMPECQVIRLNRSTVI